MLEEGHKEDLRDAQYYINEAKFVAMHVIDNKEGQKAFRERVRKLEQTYIEKGGKDYTQKDGNFKENDIDGKNYLNNKELSLYVKEDESIQYHQNGVKFIGSGSENVVAVVMLKSRL